MISTMEQWRRDRLRASERERGLPVSLGLRMSSARVAETNIPTVLRLPVQLRDETPVQDENGNFYANPDYSDPNGPDVPRG